MSAATWIPNFLEPLGMAFPDLLLFALILTTIIFWAQDIRYGILIQFVLFGFYIVWLDSIAVDLTKTLIVFFVLLVLMALSVLIAPARERVTNT